MQKKLLTTVLLLTAFLSLAQEPCNFGTNANTTSIGENMATGGAFEYTGAADFDVPFGSIFTASEINFHVLKGPANLQYVNVSFRREEGGMPGSVIQDFDALVPTAQTFAYSGDDSDFDTYLITVALPSEIVFEKGKYFLQISAAPGDEQGAWWEITNEAQTYGVFDYFKFEDEDWGGAGYYNKVFQVLGSCSDSGEVQPDYGDACEQRNAPNNYENGTFFITNGQLVSIADDFSVAPNTTFHLTDFTMHTLLLGGGLHNATINIRSSVGGIPGEVLHAFPNMSPAYEKYNGYWPFPGSINDVASIIINFSFAFEPVALEEGNYFIEVLPTLNASEFITWENTSEPGIGESSYTSFDGGTSWNMNEGTNQVFRVGGFCRESLGTTIPQKATVLQHYPNPVKDVLQLASDKKIQKVTIYNMEGREVTGYSVGTKSVDMHTLSSGMYMVKVTLENDHSEIFKVVKM